MVWFFVGLVIGFGGGWWAKGKFSPVIADIKDAVDHHPV